MEYTSTETENQEYKGLSAWLLFLVVIIAPLSGWRKLKASSLSGPEFARKVFYPIIALTSLTEFAGMFYEKSTLQHCLVMALICFASCFFSYFIIQMLFRTLFRGETVDTLTGTFGQKFSMVSVSTLAIYLIIYNLVPMLRDVLVFFPLYTVYLIFKGFPTLMLPRLRNRRTLLVMTILTLAVPLLLYVLLYSMLQGAMATN